MKYLMFLLVLGFGVQAQEPFELRGTVSNRAGEALAFATLSAFVNEEWIVDFSSDLDGHFSQIVNSGDPVALRVSYLGYLDANILVQGSEPISVVLEANTESLDTIAIVEKRPELLRKIDRLQFRVANTALATTNAWEILRQTPGVSLIGSAIAVRGSQSIVVTINDKKVLMTAEELRVFLENTEGTQLELVEVITNPPAKYEAEGTAVLNIRMKHASLEASKTTVSARYHQSKYAKEQLGITQFYNRGKWSFTGSYFLTQGTYVRENRDVVYYEEDQSQWVSEMTRKNKARGQNNYSFTLGYQIDSTASLTLGVNGYYNGSSAGLYRVPTMVYNKEGQAVSNYLTQNDRDELLDSRSGFLQYNKKLTAKTRLSWTNYATSRYSTERQQVWTDLNFEGQIPYTIEFLSKSANRVNLFVSNLDLTQNEAETTWEYGAKYSVVHTANELSFFDDLQGELEYKPEKSNVFQYKEYNVAAYASYEKRWMQWQVKAGLRSEYTDLTGVDSQSTELNSQQYWQWFPTFYLQYSSLSNRQLGLSYGKRIARPSYSWLNPAKSYYNLFSYFHGDPQLKPMLGHNLGLSYTWSNWSFEAYYQYRDAPAMEISYQDAPSKTLIYQYTNIEKGEDMGVDIHKNLQIFSWWNLSLNLTLQYSKNNFFDRSKQLYKQSVFGGYGKFHTTFVLKKEADWNLQLFYNANSPTVQGPFIISGYHSFAVLTTRNFWSKKVNISLMANDIFKSEKQKVSAQYANQNNYFIDYSDTQSLILTLRYNFGNQSVKSKVHEVSAEEASRL